MDDGPMTSVSRIGGGSAETLGLPGPYMQGGADNVECLNAYAQTISSYGTKASDPKVISDAIVTCRVGMPVESNILSSNFGDVDPATVDGLPNRIIVNCDDGHVNDEVAAQISGVPTKTGDFTVAFLLKNRVATRSRSITIHVEPAITIFPSGGFASNGPLGGPFTPLTNTYTLSNQSEVSHTWTATSNASWLDLSSAGGTLPVNGNVTLTATINSNARSLAVGSYSATITISGPGDPLTIPVTLTVDQPTGGTSGFTWQASIQQVAGGEYEGTAVLTGYSSSGGPVSIPRWVTDSITVTNPTTGLPELKWVSCRVTGFANFQLQSNAQFIGDMNVVGGFDLKGHLLKIQGDLIHQSGLLSLGGGRLEIAGGYVQGRDTDGDGVFESSGYESWLNMDGDADYMLVGGDAVFLLQATWGQSSNLSAGTLEIRGDFTAKAGYYDNYLRRTVISFPAAGTHRTLLSGSRTQTATLEEPYRGYFNILEVTNPNPLVFRSAVQTSRVVSAAPLVIQSPGEGGISGALECDITYSASSFTILSGTDLNGHTLVISLPAGGKVMQNGSLDLHGGSLAAGGGWDQRSSLTIGANGRLTVSGSYIHQSGLLSLGGGRLEIAGGYVQGRDTDGDGVFESSGYESWLNMDGDADYMLVGGDAVFWLQATWGQSSNLSAGTLEIRGDFTAKAGYYDNYLRRTVISFPAAGTHRTLLSGSGTQTATLENLTAAISTSSKSPIPIRWCSGPRSRRARWSVPRPSSSSRPARAAFRGARMRHHLFSKLIHYPFRHGPQRPHAGHLPACGRQGDAKRITRSAWRQPCRGWRLGPALEPHHRRERPIDGIRQLHPSVRLAESGRRAVGNRGRLSSGRTRTGTECLKAAATKAG